jgi:hypothetical protein
VWCRRCCASWRLRRDSNPQSLDGQSSRRPLAFAGENGVTHRCRSGTSCSTGRRAEPLHQRHHGPPERIRAAVSRLSAGCSPIELRADCWRPVRELNPRCLIENQKALPLAERDLVTLGGVEPSISRLRVELLSVSRQRHGDPPRNRAAPFPICSRSRSPELRTVLAYSLGIEPSLLSA